MTAAQAAQVKDDVFRVVVVRYRDTGLGTDEAELVEATGALASDVLQVAGELVLQGLLEQHGSDVPTFVPTEAALR